MFSPPRSLRIRQYVLGLTSLLVLIVASIPSAFSLGSAGAVGSVGATGNDPRAFPRTFHIWGGYPSSYTKYDVVIGYPSWDLSSLRAANPGAIYLANPQLDPSNPDWRLRKGLAVTYGGASAFTSGTDTVSDGSAANLGTIPGWNTYWDTLHRPDGSLALINGSTGHGGWNLTRADTAEKLAEIMAYGSKLSKIYGNGWDGIWSDNWIYRIGAGWFYGTDLDTNRDGVVDDLSLVKRQWWDGLNIVGSRLRSYLPGKIVGGNGADNISGITGVSDPTGAYKASNITMNEVLQLYTAKADTVVSEVQAYLGFADPYGMARRYLLMHDLPGGQGDYRSMRWGLSLATIAGAYYEPYAVDHNDAFSYDEFTGGTLAKRGWLGAPVTAPTKLANGVWRRDFANGVVLNNSTSSAQTVSLGRTYQRLKGSQDATVNSGASVTSVTVPAGDGLFLVGSSGTVTIPPQNTTPPVVSGAPVVGQTLSASTGTWSGSPTSYGYQWQRCDVAGANCTNAVNGTGSTYQLTSVDVGSTMRVKVTASNASGTTSASSEATETVSEDFAVTHDIAEGANLSSTVTWSAAPTGRTVSAVEFEIDGVLAAIDLSAPFSIAVDTMALANGSHVFAVTAVANDGDTATASATATVDNATGTLTVSQNIVDRQILSGSMLWAAVASGKTLSKVEFKVDGSTVATDSAAPYELTLDTKRFADGTHVFAAKATATDGDTATASATAAVNNGTSTLTVSQNVVDGQILSASVLWSAVASGKTVSKVDFMVDGSTVATDSAAPYELTLDTKRFADGLHAFAAKATAADATTASASASATVSNGARTGFSVAQNVKPDQIVSGVVDWSAEPAGQASKRVEFFVDGAKVATKPKAPYQVAFDTRKLADGTHGFGVTAYASDGATARGYALVRIANQTLPPAPAPAESLSVSQNIASGLTLSGQVGWTASPSGKTISRIEFFVDGQLSWTEQYVPYVYNGDGNTLDTRALANGSHTLSVKAYATDGSTSSAAASVTVSNVADGLVLVSSIKDGSTITGLVSWTISPSGKSVSKMDFYIDDVYKWTERLSPWVYGGDNQKLDTSRLSRGQHTLVVKALATDGTVTVLTLKVTVA